MGDADVIRQALEELVGDLPEPPLRRAWRERHHGAAPLVLLADGGDSALVALGPVDGDGPAPASGQRGQASLIWFAQVLARSGAAQIAPPERGDEPAAGQAAP